MHGLKWRGLWAGVPLFLEEWLEKLSMAGGRTTEGVFRIPGHTQDVALMQRVRVHIIGHARNNM